VIVHDLAKLLEKRIIRDVNFLRLSGAGCLLVSLTALSLSRTEHGWQPNGLTLISAGLAIAGCVSLLSGALVAGTLRKFGNYCAPEFALNCHEGDD
jgi:hypothetical protein